MHAKHVTEHKIDCLQCHLQIEHSLDRHKLEHAAADCQSCHPNHHREQVNMLQGTGGKTVPAQPNGMMAVRVECRTCHRVKEVSSTGTVLWRGSTADVLDVPRRRHGEAVRRRTTSGCAASLPEFGLGRAADSRRP